MNKITDNFYYTQNSMMGNNSYILIDNFSCFIVDPSWNSDKLIDFIKSKNLILKGIILTHLHYDHVGETRKIVEEFDDVKIIVSKLGKEIVDNTSNKIFINDKNFKNNNFIYVKDGELIENGLINFIHTPGHSQCSMCIAFENKILTGDHIFVNEIGRTDLEYSDPKEMWNSIKKFKSYVESKKINNVYPGHNEFGTMEIILQKNKYLK
ncbi:MAG: MBL fold metallo-hydrolase [Mycoplasmoidaceae bacterium]